MSNKVLLLENGVPVTAEGTANDQVLTWNNDTGEASFQAPTGGGGGSPGGTGLTYFLNYSVGGQATTPSGTWKQMSLTPTTGSAVNTGAVTAPNGGAWADLADFVTDNNEPGATTIPPGFFDVNVYLAANASANETQFRLVVSKWDGTTLTTLATSSAVPITDPTNVVLYTGSVFVPATVLSASERIAIQIQVSRTTANSHTVTGYFEGAYYSHIHTTLGAPGGTGLVKVINGVVQAPAALLFAADISGASGGLNGDGKLFIGRTSGSPAVATLTGGNNVTITNGDGSVTISASAPYDVSGEFVGSPVSSATIMRFVAVRSFTLAGTAQFVCTSNTGAVDAVFTVNVAGSSVGTVTITGGTTSGTGSLTSTGVTAGQTITVVATTPANVVNVWFTLPGTV